MPDRFAKSRDRRRPRSRRRWRGCAPGSCQHGYEGRVWDRDGRESSAPADPRRQADARPSPTASRRHLRSGVRRQKRRRLSCPGWLETRTAGDYHWSWRAGPWRGDDQDRCRQPNPTLYQRFTYARQPKITPVMNKRGTNSAVHRAACYRSGARCRRRPGPCCPLSQRARANRKPQKVCPDLRKTIMSPGCAIGRSRATGRAQCALLAFPRGV